MGSSVNPPAQRARTKAPDFSELFRSAHVSRQTPRTGAGTGLNPSSTPSSRDKPNGTTKTTGRRSMLPFLGRKKPGEQATAPATPPSSRKSAGNTAHTITSVNTVRRSFGNGHAVLMITPSPNGLPSESPLPSKPESTVDVNPSSLGSKLAAHFTPLRSPSRNSKARFSMIPKSPMSVPPLPSTLSLPVPEVRAPSIESQHSSMRSRSTTPRPLRGAYASIGVENGDEEDFSDLFTLPDQLKKLQQPPKSAPPTLAYINLGDSPMQKSGEVAPTTPITPSGPSLQFPIPPATTVPRSILVDKNSPRHSSERESSSSQGSRSPAKHSPSVVIDSRSNRTLYSEISSQDERQNARYRTTSVSGSDTDTSRANESTYSASSFRLASVIPKRSSLKSHLSASTAKTSSGPPPSLPLPSPPPSFTSSGLGPRSAPILPPSRLAFPRPRANTLSVTSNLAVPVHGHAIPKSNLSSPVRSVRANSHVTPEATIDELREALTQQNRKNVQLQEYITTITKRHEDDRMAMTRTIEKLERNIRKKMREIEGLRWLVIHNGAVSDIDAAANLARSSLSTQDGDAFDGTRGPTPLPSSPVAPPYQNGPPFHQSVYGQKGAGITAIPEVRSETSSSAASFSTSSVSDATSLTTPARSVVSEWTDGISRAERQRLKEERRASRALRRISAASTVAPGIDTLSEPSPVDPNIGQNPSMDDVLEKLEPFRHM